MKLKKAYVEITNVCNLTCTFCKKTERAKNFMSQSDFDFVISSLKPYTDCVYLHVLGEPLLHPQLGKLLETCETRGMKVNITTNGTLIKPVAETLQNSPAVRQINFSLHSMKPIGETAQQEKNLLLEILNFSQIAAKEKYIVLRMWIINEETQTVLSEIENFFGLARPIAHEFLPGNGLQVAKNIFVQLNSAFTWPDLNAPKIFTVGKCYALRDQVAVLVDGTVIPCCLDSDGNMALGNIFQNSLQEILSQERAQNMLEGFRQRRVLEDFCKTCGFGVRLNRC